MPKKRFFFVVDSINYFFVAEKSTILGRASLKINNSSKINLNQVEDSL